MPISVLKVGSYYYIDRLSFKGFLEFPKRPIRNVTVAAKWVIYSIINMKRIQWPAGFGNRIVA